MPDVGIIREFVAELGVNVSENDVKKADAKLNKFAENAGRGLEAVAKTASELLGKFFDASSKLLLGLGAAATAAGAMVQKAAKHLEDLFFAAQRGGTTPTRLRALEFALRNNIGVSGLATQSFQQLNEAIQENPQKVQAVLAAIGNLAGVKLSIKDPDLLTNALKALEKIRETKGNIYAEKYAELLPGMPTGNNLFLILKHLPDIMKDFNKQMQIGNAAGFDKLTEKAHEFEKDVRRIASDVEMLFDSFLGGIMEGLGVPLHNLADYMDNNMARLTKEAHEFGAEVGNWFKDIDWKQIKTGIDDVGHGIEYAANHMKELTHMFADLMALRIAAMLGPLGLPLAAFAGADLLTEGIRTALGKPELLNFNKSTKDALKEEQKGTPKPDDLAMQAMKGGPLGTVNEWFDKHVSPMFDTLTSSIKEYFKRKLEEDKTKGDGAKYLPQSFMQGSQSGVPQLIQASYQAGAGGQQAVPASFFNMGGSFGNVIKGVGRSLLATVAKLESNFTNPGPWAGHDATGEFQVRPSTARQYWFDPSRLNDPVYEMQVSATILQDLIGRFQGNLAEVLAGYNAGPQAVLDALHRWGSDWLSHMKKETQDYVTRGLRYFPEFGGELGNGSALGAPSTNNNIRNVSHTVAPHFNTTVNVSGSGNLSGKDIARHIDRTHRQHVDTIRNYGLTVT